MNRRRLAAILALLLAAATLVLAAWSVVDHFPEDLIVFASILVALLAGFDGVLHRGLARGLRLAVGAAALAAAAVLTVESGPIQAVLVVAGLAVSLGAARAAFRRRASLVPAPRPERPVLFFNPKSGGGKAQRHSLADEARARGIAPIELRPGIALETLVRDAVAGGADALAMAGGDGSQATVAAIAAELGLPYACVPAGTRNHFALDLGVDRNDVVGALDAFVDGGEKTVDLAEVNGRVFVNNVSLGVYAEAVQQGGYRDAKFKTLLDTVPDILEVGRGGPDLQWKDRDGQEHRSAAAILVSNNRYRLGGLSSGTRPRMDAGELGVAVMPAFRPSRGDQRPLREWSATVYEVGSSASVPAGIDGEAARLDPPLRFRSRPRVLRVRIARDHPGLSPSAEIPDALPEGLRALARIAAGR